MGVDYTAYALIGVKLDKTKCYREVATPGCACAKAIEEAKFCPQCGKPALKKLRDDFPTRPNAVICSTDDKEIFFAVAWARDGYREECLPLRSDSSHRESMAWARDFLEPLGLWDETRFGLHAVLYCSY
jgi:hypothetical protein